LGPHAPPNGRIIPCNIVSKVYIKRMKKLAIKAFLAKAVLRTGFAGAKRGFKPLARGAKAIATKYSRGLKSDNRNFGRFFRNPAAFVKGQWRNSSKMDKALTLGFVGSEVSEGKPVQALGWVVAPTVMGTAEVAGAAKSGIKALNKRRKEKSPNSMQTGGKYFGS